MNAAGGAMESPRKFNDCYFYYYSTCTKGDSCVFRHEPAALGCETMCAAWQQGKCIEKRCKLRHMELRKNRKQIPCYWENQPGGCRKKHCPFMHKNPDARTDGIAPSQPAPAMPHQVNAVTPAVPEVVEAPQVPAPAPAPVPLLWQQQRQVVLDSTILGVLPGPDMMRGRRVLGPHDAPPTYAALPVDPLVVNFEEESDNESAPSSTPTKHSSPDETKESQELLLLEKIQAEAAAYYHYEDLPPADTHRRIVRTSLNNKYDKMSLDEIAGRKQSIELRTSLDFKILSLDEIRARKKVNNDAIIQSKPITLNLNRKRKLSTHESITDSGKVIKVVRSNSVVYKKVDNSVVPVHNLSKDDSMESEPVNRKRTYSEQSDVLEINDDELDDSIQFKRVHIEKTRKPTLVRTKSKVSYDDIKEVTDSNKSDESDSEVQIVDDTSDITKINDISSDIIDLDAPDTSTIDIVDLSLDIDESGVVADLNSSNVPDIVASCVGINTTINVDSADEEAILNDDIL